MNKTVTVVSEKHREMVRMEMEGKSRREIGKEMGMHENAVGRVLLHDEGVEEYRQELVKERERECKRAKVEGELWIKGKVKGLIEQLWKIAKEGDTDAVKLSATVRALQVAGVKFDGGEEKMMKAPRIVIRDSTEKVGGDGEKEEGE